VLDELDAELEKRGHKFVRYADDCNVYVKSERAGRRVMDSLRRVITSRLRLRVNEQKSAVGKPYQRKFLGFSLTSHRKPKRRVAPQAIRRFKVRIRVLTRRMRGRKLSDVISELNSYLNGWRGYFGFCETPSVLRKLDGWIRRRLRCYLWKQWKTIARRRSELRRLNVPHSWVRTLSCSRKGAWRISAVLAQFLSPEYFDSLHLTKLARAA
jgi:RNA-directed DNA polymerase